MPIGKKAKEKLDAWLNENVNIPLSKSGHEDAGAAISAALSAGGEFLIPDDLADMAVAMVPGARLVKSAKKGMKAIKKVVPGLEKAGSINYENIKKAEDAARKSRREMFDKTAHTLEYDKFGNVTSKKPK